MKKSILILLILLITPLFAQKEKIMKISITSNDNRIIFELNNSEASKDLYKQLPLRINVENFSDNEKIFYPPNKLSTNNTPQSYAKNGTLAYYKPWGNVAIFYKDFGKASGLYELGEAISTKEVIKNLKGIIEIEQIEE